MSINRRPTNRPRKVISKRREMPFASSARPMKRSTGSWGNEKSTPRCWCRARSRERSSRFLTQPGNAPAPFTVADVSTMWMIANVIETDAPAYRSGQEVEVRVPAYPDTIFHGHVTTVGSMIDPNTRRQLVRSEIDDPQHLLRSGMFASFVIRIGDPARSPAVPVEAVVREGDGTMTVWVTADRRRFVKRTVKVGIQQQRGFSQILEGLEPGELVVTDGAVFLSNKVLLGADG
jgi:membrane fusion protein, heavy metal efflux system